jgi:AcrR family transcriptional regulator
MSPERPSMATSKGIRTRRAVLDAAIVRFGRDGYRATSVADIARDASVGGTVAYAYFPNKEALFLAALDEDAAGVINEGVSSLIAQPRGEGWLQTLIATILGAVENHPLARRVLAGLEPDVTERVAEIPALTELRKVCAERIRSGQLDGSVRPDVDPVAIGSGIVSITLSLLMSVIQIGRQVADTYGADVAAVLEAALDPTASHRGEIPSAEGDGAGEHQRGSDDREGDQRHDVEVGGR